MEEVTEEAGALGEVLTLYDHQIRDIFPSLIMGKDLVLLNKIMIVQEEETGIVETSEVVGIMGGISFNHPIATTNNGTTKVEANSEVMVITGISEETFTTLVRIILIAPDKTILANVETSMTKDL